MACGSMVVGLYTYMQKNVLYNEAIMGEKVFKKQTETDAEGKVCAALDIVSVLSSYKARTRNRHSFMFSVTLYTLIVFFIVDNKG